MRGAAGAGPHEIRRADKVVHSLHHQDLRSSSGMDLAFRGLPKRGIALDMDLIPFVAGVILGKPSRHMSALTTMDV